MLFLLGYILNGMRYARDGVNEIGKAITSNMWALVLPGMMAVKLLFDYTSLAVEKVHQAISSGAAVEFGTSVGSVVGNIMALGNTLFPLDEIFHFVPPYLTLCVAMLTIRTVKGIKQTVLF